MYILIISKVNKPLYIRIEATEDFTTLSVYLETESTNVLNKKVRILKYHFMK